MWASKRGWIAAGLTVCVVGVVLGSGPLPGAAQMPEAGICEGVICGPAGAFTVVSFPTVTDINWGAFPANPVRPYAPAEGARAIYVAPGGSDSNDGSMESPLASINTAVEMAHSGDVIWVADGQYTIGLEDEYEGLILSTPGITLAAETIGGVTLVPLPGEGGAGVGIRAEADDLVLDGFVIQGFRSVGIVCGNTSSSQHNLVLKHLLIEQTEEGIYTEYNGGKVVLDGMLAYDIWLRDIGLIALQCGQGPCNNLRWEAVRIDMTAGQGEDSGADAMAVESGENVVVFNAEIVGADGDGIDLKASRVAVGNVIVHDVGRNGIKLWNDGDVINALVYNTGADAAVVFDAGGTYRILNSFIARHAWGDQAYAMTVAYDNPTEPGALTISNSVFYQNAGPIWVSPAFTLDVNHSILFGSGNGQELVWGDLDLGESSGPLAALEAAGGGADNPGFVDPLFADPDAGDFSWGSGSPLLDGGASAELMPDFDLTGQPRIVGAAVDIGPWEASP